MLTITIRRVACLAAAFIVGVLDGVGLVLGLLLAAAEVVPELDSFPAPPRSITPVATTPNTRGTRITVIPVPAPQRMGVEALTVVQLRREARQRGLRQVGGRRVADATRADLLVALAA